MKRKLITLTSPKGGRAWLARSLGTALLAGLLGQSHSVGAEDATGFWFDHFKLTLERGERTEAAGPFYYSQQSDSNTVWAIPPFYSHFVAPGVEHSEDDVLYPLFTRVHYGQQRRWQLFELLNASSSLNPDGSTPRQFTVFPFYFQQRAADTNLNYTAVLPFYGRLKNRLFRDEIRFIMLPAYVQTRKRDLVTDNYFYPLVDVHHGDGREGWQCWPFAGHDHKVVTTQTNGYGEVSVIPGHDWSFYMWPLVLRQDNGIGSGATETFRASLPFYAASRSPRRDSTSVLWPVFNVIDDRANKYHEWEGPWPLVVFARGEGRQTSRVWPLFSESHTATKEMEAYAWPVYTCSRSQTGPADQRRTRVLYYLYSRLALKNTETGKERIRLDIWPFFTWHRGFNDQERLQVLAPLEPFVPDHPRIERNWSPLWSVWRAEDDPRTGAHSRSLLWNLYRKDVTPGHEKVSALFGLYQREVLVGKRSVRWFYLSPRSPANPRQP
jgi:hypothetical protein